MTIMRRTVLAALAAVTLGFPASAEAEKDFKVAWSIYVGWMPWGYAADAGIVRKWADKYGLNIQVTQFNDYVGSIIRSDGRAIIPKCEPPAWEPARYRST